MFGHYGMFYNLAVLRNHSNCKIDLFYIQTARIKFYLSTQLYFEILMSEI